MTHVIFLPLMIFSLLKDTSLLSSYFFSDKNIFSLIFIFPIIFMLISLCSFSFSSVYELKFYFFLFLFIFLFLFFCFCCNLPFIFLLLLESCVFLMILLIFNFSKDSDKFSSVSFMFIMNCLGSIPFMYFCFSFEGVLFNFELFNTSLFSPWLLFSCFLILISKVPVFFFHFWLTKAHVSASGSGSMVLASLMLKIGTLGIYKFCFYFLFYSTKILFSVFCSLGLLSSFILGLVMIRFFDLKYMVACSSIVHMSLIFPFSFFPNSLSILGSFMMMVGHGLISCFIFFLVTLVYELALSRSSDSGKSLESSSTSFSMIFYSFFLFNLGFPPFISFISEFSLISFLLKFSFIFVLIFCFCLMLVGLVFMAVVLTSLFGKNMKKWTGILDKLILSCFLYFFFYFSTILLIFN